MTTFRCRHCPTTYPNPIRLRAHTRDAHPEHANRPIVSNKLDTPKRGPRTGGTLKRETDVWPGKP